MKRNNDQTSLSKALLKRLPDYHTYLRSLQKAGAKFAASAAMAEHLQLSPIQVRKDLSAICPNTGHPNLGFDVDRLVEAADALMGVSRRTEVVLVGVGALGAALLNYADLAEYGIDIIAAFDRNPAAAGGVVAGKVIMPMHKMRKFVQSHGVRYGIIAVPAESAQDVANRMMRSGIRGIWNFSSTVVQTPRIVQVRNENLAASFSLLVRQLETTPTKGRPRRPKQPWLMELEDIPEERDFDMPDEPEYNEAVEPEYNAVQQPEYNTAEQPEYNSGYTMPYAEVRRLKDQEME